MVRRPVAAALAVITFLVGQGAVAATAGESALSGSPSPALPALVVQRAGPQELPEVTIVGSSPVSGTGVPMDLYPGNVQTVAARRTPAGEGSIGGVLDATVASVSLGDTQGSALQADLNYRGYTASPVLGTPQGLSVYVDGMRMNEPFGGVVSWDLIPAIAVANMTVVPGANPVYGLNTLGGALAVNTKSGFAFPGASVSVGGGSYARRTLDAEAGGHRANADYYVAASLGDEGGWARGSASIVERFFGKLGYQDEATDLDLSLQHVDDRLGAAQLVAQSMLGDAAQGYSHPDVTQTHSDSFNLALKRDAGNRDSIEGNAYYRNIRRAIANSNVSEPVTPGAAGQLSVCRAAFGSACASNIVSGYDQDIYGVNAQYSSGKPLAGVPQYFSAGINGEYGRTGFAQSAQQALIDAQLQTVGVAAFTPRSRIGSTNLDWGIYATDTLRLTGHASLTFSARFDRSRAGLTGESADSRGAAVRVDAAHAYQRLNPAAGGTFSLGPDTTLFASYAEGYRTPSAIELACADPAHPCAGVPSAFSSDPPLRGVSARSLEAGARGQTGAGIQWRAALFRGLLDNDILFHQSSISTGYFSNVGATRRQGLELSVEGSGGTFDYSAAATLLDATYRSSFAVANPANAGSACPGPACVPVRSGDRIPGVPRVDGKLILGWRVAERLRLDLQLRAQGAAYARGDENNLATQGRIPGFFSARAGADYRINRTLALDVAVTNVLDRRYATFGMLAANNLRGGAPENFWAVAPPRELLVVLRASL